jgi:hypothetical protein
MTYHLRYFSYHRRYGFVNLKDTEMLSSPVTDQGNSRPAKPIRYDIIDKQTGKVVGSAKTLARANASVDRRDNAYGAYRYRAHPVYATE